MTTDTLPKTGTWTIDPSHTQIEISARHLMVSKVRGTFKTFSGSVTIGESPEASSVELSIDTASVNTGADDRDGHLRSPDFLDVEAFPTITFQSTSVAQSGSAFELTGDLTVRGVTKPLTLDLEYLGTMSDPWGNEKAVFNAKGTFEREDWGLTWNVALDAGGVLVSKKFEIDIVLQAAQA